jgi:maltooligosyltrehalose trehalohydrolase
MAGAALLLCGPFTPMLFMGEEWGASTPWQFFTSFPDRRLGAAVRDGRRAEFAAHGWDADDVPDPQATSTFERSRLDWAELDKDTHRELLDWHRELIRLRREHAELTDPRLDHVRCAWDEARRWFVLHRGNLAVVCNFGGEPVEVPVANGVTDVLLASDPAVEARTGSLALPPEAVAVVATR